MKHFLAIPVILAFISCGKPAQESSPTTNPQFKAEMLFEHDGCRVYRFYDDGAVYFTTCRGDVSWKTSHPCGKGCIRVRDHQNQIEETP